MRSTLTNLLSIILATSSIACACPALAIDAGKLAQHSAHDGHNMQAETAEDCHSSECRDGCGTLTAVQAQTANGVRLKLDPDGDSSIVIAPDRVLQHFWPANEGLATLALRVHKDRTEDTPVTLKVRMLD